MIFTPETVKPQLARLLQEYPELRVMCENQKLIKLYGSVLVHRTANDVTIHKLYELEIVIPLYSDELPYVIDINKLIKTNYPHRYSDGRLCLATDTEIRIRFLEGFDLLTWMLDYVEVYYFSYEYFQRYGVFPFGDRSHGCRGIIQTYQDNFKTENEYAAYKIMKHIVQHPYRGHHMCPCGSGDKIRDCHGPLMRRFYDDHRLARILAADLQICESEKRSQIK